MCRGRAEIFFSEKSYTLPPRTIHVAAAAPPRPSEEDLRGIIRRPRRTQILGFDRCRDLGLKARRLLEEGRLRYLRDHGFEATLVRYVEAATTPDNLAIVARRVR